MKQAVVIVNYNGYKDTIDCIESVKKAVKVPTIIVIDNASKDGSPEKLREVGGIELILSPKNIGFTGGNNLGIKRALELGAELVFLLNNDTTVDKNAFVKAAEEIEGKEAILGGKIYYAKGYEFHKDQKNKGNILWYAGGFLDWSSIIAKHRGVDEEDRGQYERKEETAFITGCFMVIPKSVIDKIGMLDDRYFLYLEDADYCLRARKTGIPLIYCPSSVIYHRNAASTGVGSKIADYYFTRNRLLLGFKYASTRTKLALLKEAFNRHWKNPLRRQAVKDFLSSRWGNRNEEIKKIA